MKVKVTTRGVKAVDAKLSRLIRGGPGISRATVNAGLQVLSTAAKAASQGSIKGEVGWYSRILGGVASGVAGLLRLPRRGDRQGGPHGFFLDQGTKYIPARHTIGNALNAATPRAIQAAKNAGYRTAQKISERK